MQKTKKKKTLKKKQKKNWQWSFIFYELIGSENEDHAFRKVFKTIKYYKRTT